VVGGRRVHPDGLELADRRRGSQLPAGLGAGPDNRTASGVRAGEFVDGDGAGGAGLVWVHRRAVQKRLEPSGVGVEQREHELGVLLTESGGVGVPTHRADRGEDGQVAGADAWRVRRDEFRPRFGRALVAVAPVAGPHRLDVVGGRGQVREVVASEKQDVGHVGGSAAAGLVVGVTPRGSTQSAGWWPPAWASVDRSGPAVAGPLTNIACPINPMAAIDASGTDNDIERPPRRNNAVRPASDSGISPSTRS